MDDDTYGCMPGSGNFRRIAKAARVPAIDQRFPPRGCPDPDWCRGNNVCYWDCSRNFDIDSEE
jgi:hypothetical protein